MVASMMTLWLWSEDGRAVLELGDGDTALELVMYFDDAGRTAGAAWLLSQSGRFLEWVEVGVA